MTAAEIEIALKLGNCSMYPGSKEKSFASTMFAHAMEFPGKELTDKQRNYLYFLLHKYRKQCGKVYDKYKTIADKVRRDFNAQVPLMPEVKPKPVQQPSTPNINPQLDLFQ